MTDSTSGPSRRVTTDHERIREWAETRGYVPVERSGRTDENPSYEFRRRDDSAERGDAPPWEAFWTTFEAAELAFVYETDEADGGSDYHELVHRSEVDEDGPPEDASAGAETGGRTVGGATAGTAESERADGETGPDDEPIRTDDDTMLAADEPIPTAERQTAEDEVLSLSAGDEGKKVVDESGREIGIVSEVDEPTGRIYVDPDPGVTDQVKAALHLDDSDDAYAVENRDIRDVTDDRIVVESL